MIQISKTRFIQVVSLEALGWWSLTGFVRVFCVLDLIVLPDEVNFESVDAVNLREALPVTDLEAKAALLISDRSRLLLVVLFETSSV